MPLMWLPFVAAGAVVVLELVQLVAYPFLPFELFAFGFGADDSNAFDWIAAVVGAIESTIADIVERTRFDDASWWLFFIFFFYFQTLYQSKGLTKKNHLITNWQKNFGNAEKNNFFMIKKKIKIFTQNDDDTSKT